MVGHTILVFTSDSVIHVYSILSCFGLVIDPHSTSFTLSNSRKYICLASSIGRAWDSYSKQSQGCGFKPHVGLIFFPVQWFFQRLWLKYPQVIHGSEVDPVFVLVLQIFRVNYRQLRTTVPFRHKYTIGMGYFCRLWDILSISISYQNLGYCSQETYL